MNQKDHSTVAVINEIDSKYGLVLEDEVNSGTNIDQVAAAVSRTFNPYNAKN